MGHRLHLQKQSEERYLIKLTASLGEKKAKLGKKSWIERNKVQGNARHFIRLPTARLPV